jgi:hypothetical protein
MLTASVSAGLLALGSVGVTLAGWTASASVTGNQISSGSLTLDGGEDIEVLLPHRGAASTADLELVPSGSPQAALALSLEARDRTTGLCADYDPSRHGGDLTLVLEGLDEDDRPVTVTAGDLCSDDLDLTWPGQHLVDPKEGRVVPLALRVELADDALFRWSGETAVFDLTISLAQPAGGFTSTTNGTLSVAVGTYAPAVELAPGCPGTLGDHRSYHTLDGSGEVLDLDAAGLRGPAYVVGDDGDHTVVGTPGDDCLVMGDGDATLHGRDGDDTLLAGGGAVHLDGGPGVDRCDADAPVTVDGCDSGTALDALDALDADPEPSTAVIPLPEEAPAVDPSAADRDEVDTSDPDGASTEDDAGDEPTTDAPADGGAARQEDVAPLELELEDAGDPADSADGHP